MEKIKPDGTVPKVHHLSQDVSCGPHLTFNICSSSFQHVKESNMCREKMVCDLHMHISQMSLQMMGCLFWKESQQQHNQQHMLADHASVFGFGTRVWNWVIVWLFLNVYETWFTYLSFWKTSEPTRKLLQTCWQSFFLSFPVFFDLFLIILC